MAVSRWVSGRLLGPLGAVVCCVGRACRRCLSVVRLRRCLSFFAPSGYARFVVRSGIKIIATRPVGTLSENGPWSHLELCASARSFVTGDLFSRTVVPFFSGKIPSDFPAF